MAVLKGLYHYADDTPIYLTPATVSATAAQNVGPRRLIRIVSDQGINMKLGSTSGVTAPTATTGVRIPPNFPLDFQTTDGQTWAIFFNPSGSTANISIAFLSVS